MFIIGVLGGVASGKSLVAEQLEQLGAARLDADRAGHAVIQDDEVKNAIRARWGPAVLDPDGQVNRTAVARIVFEPTSRGGAELRFLEDLTHPRIGTRLEREMAELAAQGTKVAVLDAAVMLKSGWSRICDKIMYVDAPRDVRLARALRRGWNKEQFERREAAQEPLEKKREAADLVIDNSGPPAHTRAQLQQFWKSVVQKSSPA